MPQVPYQQYPTVAPSQEGTPAIRLNVSPDQFGAGVGAALSHLGGVEEHAGDELFQRALAMQQLRNESESQDADSKYMIQAGKLHADFGALEGKARVDAFPQYIQDLQDARTGIRQGMSNDMSRKMFDSSSLSTMGRTIFNGAGAAAAANREWAVGSAKARIDLDAKSVEDDPQNDALFAAKQARIAESVDKLRELQGFEPGGPEAKDLTLKTNSKLWLQRVIGLSRTAPNDASKMLDENKTNFTSDDFLKADNVVRAQGRAVGSVNIANQVFEAGQETDDKPGVPLKDMEADVRQKAKEYDPDDPILAEHAVAALRGRWNQNNYAKNQEKLTNEQIIAGGIQGGVRDIRELRLNPKVAAAIDALPKDKQLAIPGQINRYNAAVDKATNQDSYQRIYGMSNNDVESFLNLDLTKENLSQSDMRKFQAMQQKMKAEPQGDPRVLRGLGWIRSSMGAQMEALGIYHRTENNKDDYDRFTGALSGALDSWQEVNKKPATYDDVVNKIAPELFKTHAEPAWFGLSSKAVPLFNQDTTTPQAAKWIDAYKQHVIDSGGAEPTPEQLRKVYIRAQMLDLFSKPKSAPAKPAQPAPNMEE